MPRLSWNGSVTCQPKQLPNNTFVATLDCQPKGGIWPCPVSSMHIHCPHTSQRKQKAHYIHMSVATCFSEATLRIKITPRMDIHGAAAVQRKKFAHYASMAVEASSAKRILIIYVHVNFPFAREREKQP